jgi:GT2 family glycosyltransferase
MEPINKTGEPCHPSLYVVTVNWNRCQDTQECLRSLERQTYPPMGIILVDNGSDDGSAELIGRNFPGVKLIRLESNRGFAGGFNRGIEAALALGAVQVLILNNDTVADSRMVEKLMEYGRQRAGIVVPKIFYYDEPDRIWSVGAKRQFFTLEMTDKATGQVDRGQWDMVQERDYVTGCALLVHREVLEKVGLFDERYFAYYEDLDFSFRVKNAGYPLLLVPEARLWHKVARTSGGADSTGERYLMAKGSVLFFKQYGRGWRRMVVVPYRLASSLITTMELLCRFRIASILAYWRGLYEGLRLALRR